jgi:hypothetical protein
LSRCSAIKGDGERCRGTAIEGAEWCWNHHPDHASDRRRLGRKGGKRGGRGRPQADLNALKDRLITLGEDVLEGRVDRGNAAVAGQLWNIAIGAIRTGLKAKEVEELEERLEQIESALEHQKEGGGRWGSRTG